MLQLLEAVLVRGKEAGEDLGEIQGRYRGDIGKIKARYRRDMGRIGAARLRAKGR